MHLKRLEPVVQIIADEAVYHAEFCLFLGLHHVLLFLSKLLLERSLRTIAMDLITIVINSIVVIDVPLTLPITIFVLSVNIFGILIVIHLRLDTTSDVAPFLNQYVRGQTFFVVLCRLMLDLSGCVLLITIRREDKAVVSSCHLFT